MTVHGEQPLLHKSTVCVLLKWVLLHVWPSVLSLPQSAWNEVEHEERQSLSFFLVPLF